MRAWKLVGKALLFKLIQRSNIAAKLGFVSPLECRRHYLSMYTTGVLSSFYRSETPVLERLTKDCQKELCLSKTRIPHEYCKKLGLLPKRDDFECVSFFACF